MGGVLVGPNGKQAAYVSVALSNEQMELLGSETKKTIIFEAELLALVLAFSIWREYIAAFSLICFVDNNSARDVAISGNGRNITANCLIEFFTEIGNVKLHYTLVCKDSYTFKHSRRTLERGNTEIHRFQRAWYVCPRRFAGNHVSTGREHGYEGIHTLNCRYKLEAPFELLVLPAIYLIAGSGGNNFGATG